MEGAEFISDIVLEIGNLLWVIIRDKQGAVRRSTGEHWSGVGPVQLVLKVAIAEGNDLVMGMNTRRCKQR